jgi:cell division protein FtsB
MFLTLEIMVFVTVYFFGSDGMTKLSELQQENDQLEADIVLLKNEIEGIDLQVAQWNTDPYYKEKIAREQLQMARSDDQILFI